MRFFKGHEIGDIYAMVNQDGSSSGAWKIVYYPLEGTYIGVESDIDKEWIDFDEPRALIEQPIKGGIDFREVPLRYLIKSNPLHNA